MTQNAVSFHDRLKCVKPGCVAAEVIARADWLRLDRARIRGRIGTVPMPSEDARPPSLDHLITLDVGQRMTPTDPVALRNAVQALQAIVDDTPLVAAGYRLKLLRTLGCGLTALGEYARARNVLEQALGLAGHRGWERAEVATRINLGDALRYDGNLGAAAPHYEQALQLARGSVPDLVDFALQHYGKHHIDTGQLDQATACLQEALRLRVAKADQSLIVSTLNALVLVATDQSDTPHR